MKRQGRKSAAQTPAPFKDRVYGSSVNRKRSASSSESGKSIEFTDSIISGLKKKSEEYNSKHPNNKVSLATLKSVFRRGAGAYSKSHRPTITGGVPNSRNAWAYARVNKFLLKKGGTKVKAAYVQDDDLMEYGGRVLPNLTEDEILFLKTFIQGGEKSILRKFLNKQEMKSANSLVKKGYMAKGISDERGGSTMFYLDLSSKEIKDIESKFQDDDLMEYGGSVGQKIVCRNCGWHWNTKDSAEYDKYVCHNCGFDNRTFYESDPIGKYAEGGLIAPNGKKSNLTPEQYKLVRTPQFKAWFGDWENDPENASKVVDENGEPMVVYHTTNKDFNEFKIVHKYFNKKITRSWSIGSHFGTLYQAKKIADELTSSFTKPFFLNIRELKRVIDYQTWTYKDWELNLIKLGYIKQGNFSFSKIYKIIEDEKFEGFVYKNIYEGGGDSYVVLNPKSIKLADGSNTTFDGSNPDIRYEEGGETDGQVIVNKYIIYIGTPETTEIVDTTTDEAKAYKIYDQTDRSDSETPNAYGLYKELNLESKTYKFIAELKDEESIEDYMDEDYYEDNSLWRLVDEDYKDLERMTFPEVNEKTDLLVSEVRSRYGAKNGYARIPIGTEYLTLRIKDHTGNVQNKSKDDSKYFLSVVISEKDPTSRFKQSEKAIKSSEEIYFGENSTLVEILAEINEHIQYYKAMEGIEYSVGGQTKYEKGGQVKHTFGKYGGYLVGNRHSEGGIKATNKSTGQPLEMEGGEVVITRNAVSDNQKREFEGEMLTNKEILSRINQSGGGVSFADGGEIKSCRCHGKSYKYGGKTMTDFEIVKMMAKAHPDDFKKGIKEELSEHKNTFLDLKKAKISITEAAKLVVAEHLNKKPDYYQNYGQGGYVTYQNKVIPSLEKFVNKRLAVFLETEGQPKIFVPILDSGSNLVEYFMDGMKHKPKISRVQAYKQYLKDTFGFNFDKLSVKVKNALLMGNQSMITMTKTN